MGQLGLVTEMDKSQSPIAVLGAGSWGTALATLLAGNGQATLLWARDAAHVAEMALIRRNPRYLSEVSFPPQLHVHSDISQVVSAVSDVLLAVPTQGFRTLLREIVPHLPGDARIAWACKGLEPDTGMLLHEVAAEVLGVQRPVAVISGPTFAREVASGLPTAVTVASTVPEFAAALAARLGNSCFRAYTSDDVIGVEVGGAVKNVWAIAAGIADGLGFGANTRAALVTRGLAEMMRLGVVLGGQRETFMGLAGLGDLVLTCTDDQSRNRRVGLALARGQTLAEACRSVQQVAEGVNAAREVRGLARKHGVEMPITEQVCRVLYDGLTPRAAVQALLQREQKAESL
jgi:glycerol-3-phosphate dehydrogenase (NAD(P)+)